jgi:hypothetical protein
MNVLERQRMNWHGLRTQLWGTTLIDYGIKQCFLMKPKEMIIVVEATVEDSISLES